jgi:hypothetical protein
MSARFEAVIEYLSDLKLPEKSRAWRKVDFYNLAVEIDRQLFAGRCRPDPTAASDALNAFYNEVDRARHEPPVDDNVRTYFEAILQNTNDRAQRIARGRAIRTVLEAVPRQPFEVCVPEGDPQLTAIADLEEEGDALADAEPLAAAGNNDLKQGA